MDGWAARHCCWGTGWGDRGRPPPRFGSLSSEHVGTRQGTIEPTHSNPLSFVLRGHWCTNHHPRASFEPGSRRSDTGPIENYPQTVGMVPPLGRWGPSERSLWAELDTRRCRSFSSVGHQIFPQTETVGHWSTGTSIALPDHLANCGGSLSKAKTKSVGCPSIRGEGNYSSAVYRAASEDSWCGWMGLDDLVANFFSTSLYSAGSAPLEPHLANLGV